MIGNGNTMRVMSQVFQDISGLSEGWFDIEHPAMAIRGTQECKECFPVIQVLQLAGQG